MSELKHIVIVGGGSAGWITAGTLAAAHHCKNGAIKITLIESPDVATIGVGEGTWPTMRGTLQKMAVNESDFIRACDVSFKQGAKFAKWTTGEKDDFYYHPLVLPKGYFELDLFPHWQANNEGKSFADFVSYQGQLCDHHLAPKQLTTPNYAAVANYAYHLDAGKFAAFLKHHCIENLGVNFICDHMTSVISHENNDIAAINTKQNGAIAGDLFIDCTGLSAKLIGEHYQVPFISKKHILFIDTALAVQVPYDSPTQDIASHTISTAQDSGWIWDIGLPTRRGVGHVYSSRHGNEEQARENLLAYISQTSNCDLTNLTIRKISFEPGIRETFWQNNCVAVGMAAGFLEPLEASALVMIELAAASISEHLPTTREAMTIVAKQYNEKFHYNWQRIIDFLKLHYVASKRDDSAFWRDNQLAETIPQTLQELLVLWQHRPPSEFDFPQKREVFSAASYQYVLHGMHYQISLPLTAQLKREQSAQHAAHLIAGNKKLSQQFLQQLPTNRELLNALQQFAFPSL